ncbi:phosphatidylinositol 3-kinase C2 domain-containing subunit gamma [Mixophyes fleayi]|uniref:phosphatidylinositol 3-kinase C2 domain-containing subunit gamma n=1 Tax=Mixophyes fleayi TaxID=3061075 RepID=UPI003F4DEF4A
MEAGFNIGFSDHVLNSNPSDRVPQFSSPVVHSDPGYGNENPFQNVGIYGSPALGFDTALTERSNVPTSHVPYGFITNSWIEEQQSWFPPAPNEEIIDTTVTQELPNPPNVGGFGIGFVNYGDVYCSDPSVHYHHIDYLRNIDPPDANNRTLVRSHTLNDGSWPGLEEDRSHIRRASLYDGHGYSPENSGHLKPPTNDWKIQLLETSLSKNTSVSAFCEAVTVIRRGFSASDRSSNPGRMWSVAIAFPDDVADTEVEISIFSVSLQNPLHIVQRDTIRVQDLIADIFHKLHHAAQPLIPPHSLPQNQYSLPQNQYSLPQNQYSLVQDQYSLPQNQYSLPQNQYSTLQNQYCLPQNQYSAPQDQYSLPQNQYSLVQDQYSAPQDQYSAPQNQYSAPQNQYSTPQDQYTTQQNQYSLPQDLYPLSQSQCSPPQSLYPSLQDKYPLSQGQCSSHLYPALQDPLLHSQEAPGFPQDCFLSICGRDEYLQLGYSLRSHINLQRSARVQLRLHSGGDSQPPLARTPQDDQDQLNLDDGLEHAQYWGDIRKRLFSAVSLYEDQVQNFLHNPCAGAGSVLESVKEICYLLRSVETKEITKATQNLSAALYQPAQNWMQSPGALSPVHCAVTEVSAAISQLINIYSRSFQTDFQAVVGSITCRSDIRHPHLSFHLYAAHNLPERWADSENVFYMSCAVTYAGRKMCPEVKSRDVTATKSFFSKVVWDEMITFHVPLVTLPCESMLVLRLCAVNNTSPNGAFLAWSCLPLYSNQQIVQGSLLLNMISHMEPPPVITPGAFDITLPYVMTVQVEFPQSDHKFHRPEAEESSYSTDLPSDDPGRQLEFLSQRNSVLLLSELDKQCLWHYRQCANKPRNILPLLLGSAPGWDPQSISAMYRVLKDWTFSNPLEALGLLNSCFPDEHIREAACRQIAQLSNDELLGFLPQLVQAVKFDWHLDNALTRLLLQRSLQSLQVAHRLFWLLTDATNESHYRSLYQRLLSALQFCVGGAMNQQFLKQKRLLAILQDVAEKVKNSPEEKRQETLNWALNDLERFFEEEASCRLPQDPAIVVKGIDRSLCSYFKSNAKPLKISFVNADPQGPNIHVIFKVGDDIRQDMLVLQLVDLMDTIWLHEGLDLRMITYKCLSTGRKQGLIQMVPDSTTLAKIQNKTGIFGPLKDTSMKKWFTNNKTASENFLHSCAGWCVVTFILGVCDRHNDNIMLTNVGHMFHIDFGKFLGNAQTFGKVKRDRAPFIFTSEMEYFITEEGKSPHRAQEFVDLCCCAYNIVRKHSYLIINLLELMLQAGLPELSRVQDLKYVHDNLRPYDSDLKATSYFTSKFTESLQCVAVKLNFLIHAFANMSPMDAAKIPRQMTSSLPKFIRKTKFKGFQMLQKMSGKIRNDLGGIRDSEPANTEVSERGVQLHFSFSPPILSVLLKHLRNIYLPDGSTSAASVTMSLYYGNCEISKQKIPSLSKSSAPTFNKLVEFSVPQLDGYRLTFLVDSKGTFLGSLSVPLNNVPLEKDVWYRLGF